MSTPALSVRLARGPGGQAFRAVTRVCSIGLALWVLGHQLHAQPQDDAPKVPPGKLKPADVPKVKPPLTPAAAAGQQAVGGQPATSPQEPPPAIAAVARYPDLSIDTVRAEVSPDGVLTLLIHVSNVGGRAAGGCSLVAHLRDDSGKQFPSMQIPVPSLKPRGPGVDLPAAFEFKLPPGNYVYWMNFDLGEIRDGNPANNSYMDGLVVQPSVGLSDLRVAAVTANTSADGSVTLVAKVENIGAGPAPAFGLQVSVDGNKAGSVPAHDGLGAREQASVDIPLVIRLSPGNHAVLVTVVTLRVQDGNPDNNTWSGSLAFAAPAATTDLEKPPIVVPPPPKTDWTPILVVAGLAVLGVGIAAIRRVHPPSQVMPTLRAVTGPVEARVEMSPNAPAIAVSVRWSMDPGEPRVIVAPAESMTAAGRAKP